MQDSLVNLLIILGAKLEGRRLGLADAGDPDGVVSAALFKRKYPDAAIVLAHPSSVQKGMLYRAVRWDFVADLPCPGRVRVYADHHETNTPCGEVNFHDPQASAAALLALQALGLEGDPVARRLAELAVETDTANIVSAEAEALEASVKGAKHTEKLRLVEKLSEKGVEALKEDPALRSSQRFSVRKRRTEEFAYRLDSQQVVIAFFRRDIGLSYRYLTILLERRGARLVALVVPRGLFTYRVYLGAQRGSGYDVSILAKMLGGGGHSYAAGALVHALTPKRAWSRLLSTAKELYKLDSVKAFVVESELEVREVDV
ncbi:MAG: hypothetical protein QXS92_00740 [Thermofilum sp.]